ncbi:50S ribosomal protein L29 [Candidatus Adlerbacteria bacterium RIFCSPHIGHO2_12_FULL_53_18]|uniref:Large ribosomal subunit protein uL29 n=1 Tax=Candidatus Adlerbacteria bacterium RIFCSPHIGHO2_12_FULL_53_18 TaxID=1797242 RepID=A0A1F4XSH2_9BACT|nr:MAG: 50S ribosomal protein L29 [Candidatus Adlerbacteria bacterium RIFCSPHIGHO2_12_FULL_53_18]
MAKKHTLNQHSADDLRKLVEEKREELRHLRFAVAGSKNRNVKEAATLRKQIARVLTELNLRLNLNTRAPKV